MQIESNFKKLKIYFAGGVTAVLVAGIAFALASPFSVNDYDPSGAAYQSSTTPPSAASVDPQPALLEPALRSLDGVSHHG